MGNNLISYAPDLNPVQYGSRFGSPESRKRGIANPDE